MRVIGSAHFQITQSDGTVIDIGTEYTTFEAEINVSGANREGVEGEPQDTLGGLLGSPRTGQWCRFCGSTENPDTDHCAACWKRELSGRMEFSGQLTNEFVAAMRAIGLAASTVSSTFASITAAFASITAV